MRSLFFALLLFIPFSAQAQSVFTNENCDFDITFPDEFFTQQLCMGDENAPNCTEKARYTALIDTGALSVDVICVPSTPDLYETYNDETLAFFSGLRLQEMGIDPTTANFNYNENTEAKIKSSAAFVKGYSGIAPMDLILQLWFSKNSIFTLEIKLVGEMDSTTLHEQAANIISSIHVKETADIDTDTDAAQSVEDTAPSAP